MKPPATWAQAIRLGRLNALITWWSHKPRTPYVSAACDREGWVYVSLGPLEVSLWLGKRWR